MRNCRRVRPAPASVRANAIERLAGGQVGQPALLLLVRAGHGASGSAASSWTARISPASRSAAQLLDREQVGHEVAPEPAVLGRKGQSQDVVLGQQLDDVPRELGRLVDLGGARRDPLAGELRDGVA